MKIEIFAHSKKNMSIKESKQGKELNRKVFHNYYQRYLKLVPKIEKLEKEWKEHSTEKEKHFMKNVSHSLD